MVKERSCHASWQDKNSIELEILHSWIKMKKKQLELDICIEECGIYHMATLQHP